MGIEVLEGTWEIEAGGVSCKSTSIILLHTTSS